MRLAHEESNTMRLPSDQRDARTFIIGYLERFPDMRGRIHPILVNGSADSSSVLVPQGIIADGVLIRNPRNIDWITTQEYIVQLQSDEVMEQADEPDEILSQISDSEPTVVQPLLLEYVDAVTPERDEAMEQLLQIEDAVPQFEDEISDVGNQLRQGELEADLAIVEVTPTTRDRIVSRLRMLRRARIQVDNVMDELCAERESGSRASRTEAVQRVRQELTGILGAMRENVLMGEEDVDAAYIRPSPNRKRTKYSSEKEKLETAFQNTMTKVNARGFAKRDSLGHAPM